MEKKITTERKVSMALPVMVAEHLSSYGRIYMVDGVDVLGLRRPILYTEKFICPSIIAYTISGCLPVSFKAHMSGCGHFIRTITMRVGTEADIQFGIGEGLSLSFDELLDGIRKCLPEYRDCLPEYMDSDRMLLEMWFSLSTILHHLTHFDNKWLVDCEKVYGTKKQGSTSNRYNKIKPFIPTL